jgi:ABC-type dipeptide/oligopeptide/nickel transport system permease component
VTNYIIRRILLAVPTLLGVSLITFLLVRVSGDPARFVLGDQATPEAIASFRARHGLDDPLIVQFVRYNLDALRGDFGDSVRYNEPALDLITERFRATLELGLSAYVVSVLIGTLAGAAAAIWSGSAWDRLIRGAVLLLQSIPGFYLGLLLIIFVSVRLGWFPTGGRGGISHMVLPTITLSTVFTATIVRFARSSMLDVLNQDYVRTARAKGLAENRVISRHVLRNALVPLLTVLALQSAVVFSGAVVTETVFSWPGIGRLVVSSIQTRDYPVVQGTVLLLTTCVVLLNIAVDIAYGVIDPRIKFS